MLIHAKLIQIELSSVCLKNLEDIKEVYLLFPGLYAWESIQEASLRPEQNWSQD
jgi:hypothetical protein